jgi:tRNA A-37 threonylcarbamoyl transferase component Bud32
VTGLCATHVSKPELPRVAQPVPAPGPVSLTTGSQVGGYRLQKLLGRGASSDVFYAENEVSQAAAAVKVLRAELHDDPELVRRFDSEARTTNLVRHEHIVEILDIGVHAGWQHYILLELLEGVTLAQLLSRPVAPALATKLTLQLCAALGAAHAKGVVHRDLKPANIFVLQRAGQPHAKLVDFGMAHRARLEEGELRTRVGSILGTALYMSPEQVMGGVVDARTDVYALGAVMFELATGRGPFQGTSPVDVMSAHVHKPPPRPISINPSVPVLYDEVILRCLAKKPEERFQSMAELGRAIVGALEGKTPQAVPAAGGQPRAPVITAPLSRSKELPTDPAGIATREKLGAVRRQARIPTSFGVQLFTQDGALLGDALVTDVSLGGAFIRTTLVLPLFSRVRLQGATSEGPLDALGEIVRLELNETDRRGFGVRFDALSSEQQRTLEALVQRRSSSAAAGDPQAEALLLQLEPRATQGYYALLGLPKDTSTRRVRDVCERLHEELMPARFKRLEREQAVRLELLKRKLMDAEEELIDPSRRALYDAVNGNVLGVLRCVTEGLDLSLLEGLRAKFLKARPNAESLTRAPLEKAAKAQQEGDFAAALQLLADALCHDPLNLKLHRLAAELRTGQKRGQAAISLANPPT